ncbi:centrobin isoform X2 [Megalobrama amblycephala]|uniref:centrobin isoform X2 n=1 Tax=Megalobrama amblycephala TaxID=75352 RepID=UPI00201449CC|nr:centrobin isoform X2 [Megalobrama amblycephala]
MSVSRADDDDDAPPLHHSSLPALTRSWPSSPLSASRQVTARLYSSLQHSREQEVKGHAARQVSFALSSPDLTAVRATAATPPLLSHRLEDCSLDSASTRDVIGSGEEGVESEVDELSGEMDLHLQNSLSKSTQLSSGRRHIEEMESVRTHLQSILRPTQTAANRHDFLTPASQHFLDDSHESDATSHLLSAVCLGGVEELFPRYSRLHVDSSGAASELQVLRESLQRERDRRKVCEQQVASLHSRVLQFQQQLTLAVAADRKKDIMIEQLDKEQQVYDLRVRVEDLQQEEQKLRRDGDRDREQLHKLQTESHNTRTQLQQHIQELQQQLQELQQQLHTHTDQVKQEVAAREEAESRTQRLQEELETCRRERDAQRVERAMEQTRFEAQKSQMEAEFRLSLEQQLTERLTAVQEENAAHNTQLRQQHRKQLLDLSARHEREQAAQLDLFRTQLQERDDKLQHLTHTYQHKLSEMQEELVSMAASKRKLETQREELVSRLQGMMRSHWAEALRLLTNQEQMESVLSPIHRWEMPKTSSSPPKSDTRVSAAPQAVVLHLSREKERGMRAEEPETRSHRETSSNTEFSTSFCPLEPQLDHTDLTALSDCSGLWARPVFAEDETMKDRKEETRETQTNLNLKQILNHSQCEPKQKLSHAPTDTRTNHSSAAESGLDRGGASGRLYYIDAEKAPPTRDEAPPSRTRVSSLNEDRQSELQYYVSKLLERSPGDPVDEPIREQRCAELRANLEQKPDQHEKQEARVSSRVVQSRRSSGRRGGSQRVWR